MTSDRLTGMLLTNIGSPESPTPAAVRRYLRQFLSDPLVVDAPRLRWLLVLNLVILPLRAPRAARLYRSIWTEEGAPLLAISRRQATALQRVLENRRQRPTPVAAAMRYGSPSLDEGLSELGRRGCSRVLVLPLYPQVSRTTVGTTAAEIDRLCHQPGAPETRVVEGYSLHVGYLDAVVSSIREARGEGAGSGTLLLSFHGLPRRYVSAGDPYENQCRATADGIAERLGLPPGAWQLGFQSRFGREEWLQPYTDHILAGHGSSGSSSLDVVCPGFATDCLETLEEIATAGRATYERAGGQGFRYIPALNDRPDHIAALADIAVEHLGRWEQR